ncbi:MAG: type II toxin-antitoxin system death-on-curing family toxin [Candidatus Micrarchaeota archaeon]
MIKYPTRKEIIELNRQVTSKYGDVHSLLSEANLEYIIEMIKIKFENRTRESIIDKSALLMSTIAKTHPFIDGNKRTAYLCGMDFLKDNGFSIRAVAPEIATGFMMDVASEKVGPKGIRKFIIERVINL